VITNSKEDSSDKFIEINILIHAITSKEGGGKYIIINFVNNLRLIRKLKYFLILPASIKNYISNSSVELLSINHLLENWWLAIIYYRYYIFRLIRREKINVTWNFGDVIIPGIKNQIYYFDWAYLVYNESYLWSSLSKKMYFKRKLKIAQIEKDIKKVDWIFVQTENMKVRLKDKYGLKNISILETPVSFPKLLERQVVKEMNTSAIKYLYVSSYSSHKNHKILLEVGREIKKRELDYKIYITIDKNETYFLSMILKDKLNDIIINLGNINHDFLSNIYLNTNFVLIPTLLESYGIPYFEAMYFKKQIITSDLDFAHEACHDIALYFNPFSVESILSVMKEAQELSFEQIHNNINKGRKIIEQLPSWEEFIDEFNKKTKSIYGKR